ncbi:MAG: rhodanese-related sulfurtransferase [Pseudobdellovibrionaceae bacterium]
MTYRICALYRFVSVSDLDMHQATLKAFGERYDLCGTLLIAPEGINGTIGSSDEGVDVVLDYLEHHFGIHHGEVKFSESASIPFLRYKVRIKKEIVTLRQPQADPSKIVGTYVEPENWNALVNDPDVILLDTRNDYETRIGIFQGAIDPNIKTFTEFVDYVRTHLDPQRHKKIAMFCTGGIRCEKASSFMLAEGFNEVYHLKGGILKYLETVPPEQSKWDGECFVFDRRVGVGHGLSEGTASICYSCRATLTPEDRQSPQFEHGVSCPQCHDSLSDDLRAAKRMRHTQMSRIN